MRAAADRSRHHLDPPAGWVGNDVTMDVDLVDDHDFASAQVDTAVGVRIGAWTF